MPYDIDDPDLPENVKKLPAVKRRQWVHVWNSAYDSCIEDGGEAGECESEAYERANGVVKEGEMEGSAILFTELQSIVLEPGKPFDGVAPGEFYDMWGRRTVIKPSSLKRYLKNTKAAIEYTKAESGEVVGLPIDCYGHDNGDGAGWIIDAFLESVTKPDGKKLDVIRFIGKWTEVGRELIEGGIRRMFSPTIDTDEEVVLGGSLTNWPATRDEQGKVLLRPIELAEPSGALFCLAQNPLATFDDSEWDAAAVKSALDIGELRQVSLLDLNGYPGQEGDPSKGLCYLPVRESPGAAVNKAALRACGGGHGITAVVKPDDVPESFFAAKMKSAANKIVAMWPSAFDANAPEAVYRIAGKERPDESEMQSITDGGIEMEKDELIAVINGALAPLSEKVSNLEARLSAPPANGDEQPVDILSLLEMEGEKGEIIEAVRQALLQQYGDLKTRASREAAEMVSRIKHEDTVKQFTALATGGGEGRPRGISVKADDLERFCMGLSREQFKFFSKLIGDVQSQGMVEFEEVGSNGNPKGTKKLPDDIVRDLRSGELKITDLSDPILAPALGDLAEYDLSEFKVKGG
jgi:hypothetical protein